MFSRAGFGQIRDLEAFVYEGPETVEHVYETDDSYQSHHEFRKRGQTVAPAVVESLDIWYRYKMDEKTGEMIYG